MTKDEGKIFSKSSKCELYAKNLIKFDKIEKHYIACYWVYKFEKQNL